MALYDEKLLKELFVKHYEVTPNYRVAIQHEYFELTGKKIPMPTLRDRVSNYRFSLTKTFNERTDDIIDQPKKLYTSQDLLEAMGVDPQGDLDFDRATVNRWWLDKGDILERIRNGQLKIQLKKKEFVYTKEIALEVAKEVMASYEPIHIECKARQPYGMLLIPLKDMHFGLNTYEDYKGHQAEIYRQIKMGDWERIVFIVGSDLFQTNDSKGRTYNDTDVARWKISLVQERKDAMAFYRPLIDIALEHSLQVTLMWESGNHDRDRSLDFVLGLADLYPDCEVITDEDKHYQEIIFHDTWIGTTHGDLKNKPNQVGETFYRYFGENITKAHYSEILVGHLHHLFSAEYINTHIQGLSTASKDSDFDYRIGKGNGYKAFVLRIYSRKGFKGSSMITGGE